MKKNLVVDCVQPRAGKAVSCVFGACELPIARYRIAVTPFNSFGLRGRTIYLHNCRPGVGRN